MKRAVALGCRSAAAVKAVGHAAAVPLVTPHSAAVADAATTAAPSHFFSRSRSSALLGQPIAYTRRGRGGAGTPPNLHSLGLTWGRATGRIDVEAVGGPLGRFAFPSSGASAAIPNEDAATSASAATAAAAAAASSLLQRRTLHQHQRHWHLNQWSIRHMTAQSRPATENTKGPEGPEGPDSPRAAAAKPTRAPPHQQQHEHPQQQQQQQHQQHQPRSEGTGDTRGSARKIGTIAGGPGGSPGVNGTKWGLLGALGGYVLAAAKKLTRLMWRFVVAIGRYTMQFVRNPRIVEKWYAKAKEATIHTWRWCCTGFRLFFANVRVSYQLLKKKILGYPLRYNEHKLLVRTTADALKLIPFSLLIIIPLGELLIPVALRLFPNMLPSTFQQKPIDHAYLTRKLKAKQELASFFQELLQERTRELIEQTTTADSAAKAKALKSFQAKLLKPTTSGEPPLPGLKEVLEFSRLFKDEFVLNKMDLQTLQVMCKLLGLQPYSVRSHVVLQLRHHINHIQREDREFMWEGVESLTHEELVEACRDRGMKFYGTTDDAMREQMRRWLEVSSHRDVPPILLLWSRCVSMIPAVHLPPPAAAAAAVPSGAAEAKPSEPSISLAAVADQRAAAAELVEEQKKEEAKAAAQAAGESAAEAEPEADALRKTASLEAMTRQVEMLREEEESLRHSISLLQEERAQHKQMQKMQAQAKEDTAADSSHQATPLSKQQHETPDSEESSAAAAASHVSPESPQGGAEDAEEAETVKEGREGRDVERELRLLRQLTDIQHEHEERQFHVFNQVQMAVEALKTKLAPPSREKEGETTAGEELKPDPNEELRMRAAELLHDELHELDLCMALLAQEFAEDAKEVEHFMTDAREPTDDEKPEAGVDEESEERGTSPDIKAGKDNVGNAESSAKEAA